MNVYSFGLVYILVLMLRKVTQDVWLSHAAFTEDYIIQ